MNGEVCCILGVCCPVGSDSQINALAKELVTDNVCGAHHEACRVAEWVLKNFDLAPAGTLTDLKSVIAKLAREK